MWTYDSDEAALTDVLRLSRGMTYKNSAAGLPLGGGKTVVIGDPRTQKSELLFRALGRFIESLGGRYLAAEDVGTSTADAEIVARETRHITGLPVEKGGSGDPSPMTAWGVFCGMRAAIEEAGVGDELRRACGSPCRAPGTSAETSSATCSRPARASPWPTSTPIGSSRSSRSAPRRATRGRCTRSECDVYSPCALGAVIRPETVAELRCRVVAGAANNQLLDGSMGDALHSRGILYAPDFVINAGGVINIAEELGRPYDADRARTSVERIADTLAHGLRAREGRRHADPHRGRPAGRGADRRRPRRRPGSAVGPPPGRDDPALRQRPHPPAPDPHDRPDRRQPGGLRLVAERPDPGAPVEPRAACASTASPPSPPSTASCRASSRCGAPHGDDYGRRRPVQGRDAGRRPRPPRARARSRSSRRSSCTAGGRTCSGTCSSCGSSGTTSRTGSGARRFLLFYLAASAAHRGRRRRLQPRRRGPYLLRPTAASTTPRCAASVGRLDRASPRRLGAVGGRGVTCSPTTGFAPARGFGISRYGRPSEPVRSRVAHCAAVAALTSGGSMRRFTSAARPLRLESSAVARSVVGRLRSDTAACPRSETPRRTAASAASAQPAMVSLGYTSG